MAYDITKSPRQRLIDEGRLCCEGGEEPETFFLLQENGDFLLQETEDKIILE